MDSKLDVQNQFWPLVASIENYFRGSPTLYPMRVSGGPDHNTYCLLSDLRPIHLGDLYTTPHVADAVPVWELLKYWSEVIRVDRECGQLMEFFISRLNHEWRLSDSTWSVGTTERLLIESGYQIGAFGRDPGDSSGGIRYRRGKDCIYPMTYSLSIDTADVIDKLSVILENRPDYEH